MKLDFTSRSTKRVFVNCQVFEISGNSKGGQVAKRKGHKNFFFFVLLLFLVCINTDSKVQTGATLFKTALKVELFSCFDKGPITRARKKILAVKMNKWFGTVIWLGNLEWCICILKRKSGFLSQVFVFYSAANVGDFCSFKGYADRPEIQKFIKKIYFAFSVKRNAFL